MKATELFQLRPYGATVIFTDGTPKPPARHTKKVQAWENRNNRGLFVGVSEPSKWDGGGFQLQMLDSDVLVMNRLFSNESQLEFAVELPAPGTIMSYSQYEDKIEVAHVWKSMEAAKEWAQRKSYDLFNHGRKLWIVGESGVLEPLTSSAA